MRSPFDTYLNEINHTPLLSAEEEQDLAKRIANGDAEARDHLARANLRLVVRLARHYAGKGLLLEDLIAEGNLGLMRAVESFNPAAGVRFCTYAAYWIKQSIRVSLNKYGHAVRLPQYMGMLLVKWGRSETTLRDELGRVATTEEVADRLGLTGKQTRAAICARKAILSGRGGLGTEEFDLTELYGDGRQAGPEELLALEDEIRTALKSLEKLEEREEKVLRMRFGLDGGDPVTLREVGDKLGFTRERARQVEQGALTSLRERLDDPFLSSSPVDPFILQRRCNIS